MKRFSELYENLDSTTSTLAKIELLKGYFAELEPEEAAWALYFLSGRRPKRLLSSKFLKEWLIESGKITPWLFEECYATVGDLAETISLLSNIDEPPVEKSNLSLSRWMVERILPLANEDLETQKKSVLSWWKELRKGELFILNKLLTGSLRVGVSQILVVRALSELTNIPIPILTHRLMGSWNPNASFYEKLIQQDETEINHSRPYPFYLASPLDRSFEELGSSNDWFVEWKWDGIRAQLVIRKGEIYLWSRGEELITERFPEIAEEAKKLPNEIVLDGEILAYRDDAPLPFAILQKRIGRLKLTPKILKEAPIGFIAYDLLEFEGKDYREKPLQERRVQLEKIIKKSPSLFQISPLIKISSWDELENLRQQSRSKKVEGLMLKKADSPYETGRKRGAWWKWKVDPYTVDAVMIYAQAGHGRRATLFTDYTFAVWKGKELVPIAKAYSGLTDEEIKTLDRWIRTHTKERFGPVRSVEPVQVFELAFENIQHSSRHKSGVALRFPRILRWRTDKPADQANTLQTLIQIIETKS